MSEPLRFWWLYNLLSLSWTHSSSTESWCLLLALTQQFPVPVWTFLCYSICVFVCAQLLLYTLHHCIVNSLLTKLLNGIAYYFWGFFCIYSFPPCSDIPLSLLLITGERIGSESFIFHFGSHHWWPVVLIGVTCELHAAGLWKGLTLPFNSTSAPRKTGEATVRLVDYRSHSQMPSNDYLAGSQVQHHGSPPGFTVHSQQCPDKQIL